MTKLGDALRRKFKTPEAAIKALGLDESVLKTVMAGDKKLAGDAGDPNELAGEKRKKRSELESRLQNLKRERPTESGRQAIQEIEQELKKLGLDSTTKGSSTMSAKAVTLTRKAAMVMGGVVGFLKPKLAKDAKLDWAKLFGTVTGKNFASKKGAIVAGIKEQTRGKLAKDASIDGLVELLDGFEKVEGEDDLETKENSGLPIMDPDLEDESMDDAEDPHGGLKEYLRGKGMSEDDIAGACDALGSKEAAEEGEDEKDDEAEDNANGEGEGGREDSSKFAKGKDKSAKDEPPPFKGKPEVGGGMSKDAVNKAIAQAKKEGQLATDAALKAAREQAKATRDAERFVRPWVGDLAMAHDSAEEVYRTTLTALGKDVKGVHPSAFKTILEGIAQPGKKLAQDTAMAEDAHGASSSYFDRFPGAKRIGFA